MLMRRQHVSDDFTNQNNIILVTFHVNNTQHNDNQHKEHTPKFGKEFVRIICRLPACEIITPQCINFASCEFDGTLTDFVRYYYFAILLYSEYNEFIWI